MSCQLDPNVNRQSRRTESVIFEGFNSLIIIKLNQLAKHEYMFN